MRKQINSVQKTASARVKKAGRNVIYIAAIMLTMFTLSCSETDQADQKLLVDPVLNQAVFAEPANAADAFAMALENKDEALIQQLFGEDYVDILSLQQVAIKDVDNYLTAWNKANSLQPLGDNKMLISIGTEGWTLPIPIVKGNAGWYFDTVEGAERMAIRRVGRNELAVMQVVLAYYDAQMEYAEQDRNGNGFLEYAQKLISTPGTMDGLFWQQEDGGMVSPLGPLLGDHAEGEGYHGYRYKILTSQGESAKGGAYNYVLGNRMRSGFALVAWPKEYGDSGVMSFIVSHEGIVYEKNLGPDSAELAAALNQFNPDEGWAPSKEVSGP